MKVNETQTSGIYKGRRVEDRGRNETEEDDKRDSYPSPSEN